MHCTAGAPVPWASSEPQNQELGAAHQTGKHFSSSPKLCPSHSTPLFPARTIWRIFSLKDRKTEDKRETKRALFFSAARNNFFKASISIGVLILLLCVSVALYLSLTTDFLFLKDGPKH